MTKYYDGIPSLACERVAGGRPCGTFFSLNIGKVWKRPFPRRFFTNKLIQSDENSNDDADLTAITRQHS